VLTRRLDQAAATIGLRFLGHILVAGDRWSAIASPGTGTGTTGSGGSARGRDKSSREGSRGGA
jgi:DNA repair protein RadC